MSDKKRRWLKRTNLFVIYAVWIAGISQVWKDISIGHTKTRKAPKNLSCMDFSRFKLIA